MCSQPRLRLFDIFFGAIMLAPLWITVMRRLLMDKKNQTSEAVKTESKSLKFFILSGAIHNIAAILWFYATIHVLIANVTAIGYSIPLYVTIGGSIVFWGEFNTIPSTCARYWVYRGNVNY